MSEDETTKTVIGLKPDEQPAGDGQVTELQDEEADSVAGGMIPPVFWGDKVEQHEVI